MPEVDQGDIASRLARLTAIPPQQATPETVAEAWELVARLTGEHGKPLWFDAQTLLGHHLLESPAGERAKNIADAEAAYRRVLEYAPPGSQPWCAGEFGLANALLKRPDSGAPEFREAAAIYERLIEHAEANGLADDHIKFLGNAASMYGNTAHGDLAAHLEKAIKLQERVLQPPLLPSLTQATRGRARHNLAALYLRRKDVTSLNLDRAVRLLELALEDRTEHEDPVGRVRTLRALSIVYPKWGGADSPAHANALAQHAAEEAHRIETNSAVMEHRLKGWARLAREQSALNVELPELEKWSRDDALDWLSLRIQNHLDALAVIPRDSEPLLWADWRAGHGRLLALLPRLGVRDQIGAAFECFREALQLVNAGQHTRLYCDIVSRMGALAHEVGDFETSCAAYSAAAKARDVLMIPISDFDHRIAELKLRRGYGLYAAYAASRLEHAEEAMQLAEGERVRVLDELIESAQMAAELPAEQRDMFTAAVRRLRDAQARLSQLKARTADGVASMYEGILADMSRVSREIIPLQRLEMPEGSSLASDSEIQSAADELKSARMALQRLKGGLSNSFDATRISALAQSTGAAIAYILATTWGTELAVALPDGGAVTLHVADLTTERTVSLVHGDESQPSLSDALASRNPAVLASYLEVVADVIGGSLLIPFASWLHARGVTRAVVIPAGSFSALPLQVIQQQDVTFSFAPSARLLGLSRPRAASALNGPATILANPAREDHAALPWSVVECRYLEQLRAAEVTRSHVGSEATLAALQASAAAARYVHISAHAEFRPADPLSSSLMLAGDDMLSLQGVMRGDMDLSSARVVNLAACQTANAEYVNAPDEHLGFGSILMSLGVPAVVSARWNVDDAAAALFSSRLMELLHEERLEPIDAVSRARDWLRTATAAEMKPLVTRMQKALRPEDHEARVAVASLRSELAVSAPDETTRFASVVHWGAFMLTGL